MIDLEQYQDPLTIQRVLHTAKTIAIVGLSKNELRASYFVGYYLKRHGYRVIPVNPRETEILGETSYPSLLEVPVPVDVVNVFRAPDALPGIARDAVSIGAGAVFSFDCAGGRAGGQDLIRGVSLWSHLANVGDAKSLIIHPASTTHRQLSDDELRAAGVGAGTVRLSVGTESVEDLIWDLEQGFKRVAATTGERVATT